MKNKLLISAMSFFAGAFILSSCSKKLDITPTNALNSAQVYL